MNSPDKVEKFLRDFVAALQVAKIYSADHPVFSSTIERLYVCLQDAARDRESLVIGIVDQELACDKEIFFDLSKKVRAVVAYFKDNGIERIIFRKGAYKDELGAFVGLLAGIKPAGFSGQLDINDQLCAAGVRNIEVSRLSAEDGVVSQAAEAATFLKSYNSSLDQVSQSVNQVLNGETVDPLQIKFSVNSVMESLAGRYNEFLKLTAVKKYDTVTFMHLLNVSVVAMYFSSRLGFSREDVLDIGSAALFHDIGKVYISRKIIQKEGSLTVNELDRMKSHSLLGAEILLNYTDTMGILPSIVALEHHLRYDVNGYPRLPYVQPPNYVSLLVSVCDVYDALIQRRSYKGEYPPDRVYSLMMKEKGGLFDPGLLDSFFRIMGVWTCGTIVELSDGRVAVVREVNEDAIFAPKVEVVSGGDKGLLDLKGNKQYLKIEKALNPWKEGADYVKCI